MGTGDVAERLHGFVVDRANRIIAFSVPAVVLSMAVMILLGRAGIDEHSGIDYQVYRWAVHTWLAGGDLVHTAPTVSIGRPLPWVYPPFALLPLLPFALLPFVVGLLAMYLVDFLAIGGALYEELRYADNGQPTSATFLDYLCPTAAEMGHELRSDHLETPSPLTRLGAKGCGEGSCMSLPVAIANAVADALAPRGVDITALPIHGDVLHRLLDRAAGEPEDEGEN